MHAVQTFTRLRAPEIRARTDFKFGFQRRRRVLLAWLTTLPKLGPLPQYSHFIAMIRFLFSSGFVSTTLKPFSNKLKLQTRKYSKQVEVQEVWHKRHSHERWKKP